MTRTFKRQILLLNSMKFSYERTLNTEHSILEKLSRKPNFSNTVFNAHAVALVRKLIFDLLL